jgi:hypothetical protein
MRLRDKLNEVFAYIELEEKLPVTVVSGDESVTTYIPAIDRWVVKFHYLEFMCRKIVRFTMNEDDHQNLILSNSAIEKIDNDLPDYSELFPLIKNLYMDALNNDVDRLNLSIIRDKVHNNPDHKYEIPILKMLDPYQNRALFIWDIVWGLLTVYGGKDKNGNDKILEPVFNSSASGHNNARNLLFMNVERRLRKIERMRYNVSGRIGGDVFPFLTGQDGHTLRLFEYPKPFRATRYWVPSNYWEQEGETPNFKLSPTGRQDPIAAIKSLFRQDEPSGWINVEARTENLCDKVIHILHLEELALHLERSLLQPGATNRLKHHVDTENENRIAIVSSFTNSGSIGSGEPVYVKSTTATDGEPAGETNIVVSSIIGFSNRDYIRIILNDGTHHQTTISGTPSGSTIAISDPIPIGRSVSSGALLYKVEQQDPYFEYIRDVRLDELIPGDHIIIDNYPAYASVSQAVWKNENALVMRTAGLRIPADIDAQGHGLPPLDFRELQKHLLRYFQNDLRKAQDLITAERTQEAMTRHTEGTPYRIYRRTDATPGTPDWERIREFRGMIEFRNELIENEFNNAQAKRGFWSRWLLSKKSIQVDAEFSNDNKVKYLSYDLPFVDTIDIDYSTRTLNLRGFYLSEDKVESIYFVLDPRRTLVDPVIDHFIGSADSLLYSHSGIKIPQNAINFSRAPSGIEVTIPSDWTPTPNHWKPIISSSFGIEVRAERSFKWPESPPSGIEGHGEWNIAYFPLFQERNVGSGEFDLPTTVTIESLIKYYREHEPEHSIKVIRPLLEDRIGGT